MNQFEIERKIVILKMKISRAKAMAPFQNGSDHPMFCSPEQIQEMEEELHQLTQINES